MSVDDGPGTGSPNVGNALVAALGFEPTDGESEPAAPEGADAASDGANGVPGSPDASRGPVTAPAAEGSAEAPVTVASPPPGEAGAPPLPLPGGSNGSPPADGDNGAGEGVVPATLTAETSEFAAIDKLPDTRSSGVKPIVASDDGGDGGVGLEIDPTVESAPDSGEGLAAQPTLVAAVDTDTASPTAAYADEASALLAGTDTPLAPPGLAAEVDPLIPSGPATSPPLAGATVGAGPTVARRDLSVTEGVAERVSDLVARVPQLLDGGLFRRTRRVQARKVRRVVRHVDPWSMLTFSVLFHLCVFASLLLASVLVWNAAVAAGTIENIESFIRELGDYKTYEINGDVVFRAAMVIAGILTLASSVLAVLLTVVFNLISDLVGGIRFTVVEEETVRVRRKRNQ